MVLWPYLTGFYLLGYVIARAYYHSSEPAAGRTNGGQP